jgi:hypothetical protein
MENFPGQGKLAINGAHPPPPPGLMTFAEFKAKFEHRVRALLMGKEKKMPSIEKVNFMINHEYSTYIQRNVKPKKVDFQKFPRAPKRILLIILDFFQGTATSINSWGMSTIGEKLCELNQLPNLEDVVNPFPPLVSANNWSCSFILRIFHFRRCHLPFTHLQLKDRPMLVAPKLVLSGR